MDTERRQHLQDIYATDHTKNDDYTPQVSSEIIEERKRDARRQQFTTFMLGITVLGIAVGIIVVVANEYMNIQKDAEPAAPMAQEYIPRHSLPSEAQWVIDLSRNFGDPTYNEEGERPFNTVWIKKAAWNIWMAEQAMELAKGNEDAYGKAAQYYEQALEILPDLEGVKVPLGMVYFRMKDYDKALDLLQDAPESDLTFDVLNNLGVACLNADAYDRAEEYLKRSLELKPAYAEALKNTAMLYRKQEREEEATKAYEQYLDQRPLDDATRNEFALYLTKVGNWELASEQLRTLANNVKDDHYIYFLLARAENKLGNKDAATKALRRGIQLVDPELAIVWMDDAEFDQLRNSEEFQALMQYVQQQGRAGF